MKNKDESLRIKKILSFMKDDLQKNGYTIEQKSFDFSNKGIIRYSNSPEKNINNGSDFVNIKKGTYILNPKNKFLTLICKEFYMLVKF